MRRWGALRRRAFQLWGWLPLPEWARWLILWLGLKKFLVGTMAVVVDDAGRVLLFRHTYRPDHPWGLPGGWLRGGERAAEAVAREVLEESGFVVRVVRPLLIGGDQRFPRLDLFFHCELVAGEFRPCAEVSAARFFTRDELRETLEPYQYETVATALARLNV